MLFINYSFSQNAKNIGKKDNIVDNSKLNQVELTSKLILPSDYNYQSNFKKETVKLDENYKNIDSNINDVSESKICLKIDDLANYKFSKKEIQKVNGNENNHDNEIILESVKLILVKTNN